MRRRFCLASRLSVVWSCRTCWSLPIGDRWSSCRRYTAFMLSFLSPLLGWSFSPRLPSSPRLSRIASPGVLSRASTSKRWRSFWTCGPSLRTGPPAEVGAWRLLRSSWPSIRSPTSVPQLLFRGFSLVGSRPSCRRWRLRGAWVLLPTWFSRCWWSSF